MQQNLGLYLSKRAQISPGVEALIEVERGTRYTYADLNARCNRIANVLLAEGVKPGDRVAFLLMNGVEYIEAYYAVAKIGAVMVPLNWRLVPDELAFILKDSGSTVLIFDKEFDQAVVALRELDTDLGCFIRVGEAQDTQDFALHYEGECSTASPEEPEIVGSGDDLLFIMYTSGTTGLPKGAVHTHNTMVWACSTVVMTADVRYRDRYLQMLPMFHVGALMPVTMCLIRGMTAVNLRAFDPVQAWKSISEEKVTVALGVPAMLQFMLQVPELKQYDFSQLRWILSGAAPVPVTLIEAYSEIGIEIHQIYGLTETCGPACLISPEEALAKAGSTGPGFLYTAVRVVTGEGEDVSPGEIGEVIVSCPHLMKEYWNRPEATAETIRDGWLYTGDLATTDKEGFVYIQDRKKDMIISGGENIYPAEIENVLVGHPSVVEAAVIGQPSGKWGESPAAIVVVKQGETLSAGDVMGHCKGKLAGFKQPKTVEFVDEIPRNPSGKILKRILRDRFPGPAPE
jgi:O-succinylbenzoate-CoA ligase